MSCEDDVSGEVHWAGPGVHPERRLPALTPPGAVLRDQAARRCAVHADPQAVHRGVGGAQCHEQSQTQERRGWGEGCE